MDTWMQWDAPIERLTPPGEQCFFGYYDHPADNEWLHLCHRTSFADRLQRAGDRAEVGTIPLQGGSFTPLDETCAWCFQQGAMLQFLPGDDQTILYNVELNGSYGARARRIGGPVRAYDQPITAVSPTGIFYLSVNMARLYAFRPGYGYAGRPDLFADEATPEEDGVWRVDMATGRKRLILSLARLAREAEGYFAPGEKLCINHLTVAPGGQRFVLLLRNMESMPWKTRVLTADCEGREPPFVLLDEGMASHYRWVSERLLLFYCRVRNQDGLFILEDGQRQPKPVAPSLFAFDGHMSLSPDGRWLSYDSYPDNDGRRSLLVYHVGSRKGYRLARLWGPNPVPVDIRCDLHPRWSRDGSLLTFDSIHEGFRGMYAVRTKDLPTD